MLGDKIASISQISKYTGEFGLGSASYNEAMALGRQFVGDGYRVTSGGGWLSACGTKSFRFPKFKPKQGVSQANFEWRSTNKGRFQTNLHLIIK